MKQFSIEDVVIIKDCDQYDQLDSNQLQNIIGGKAISQSAEGDCTCDCWFTNCNKD